MPLTKLDVVESQRECALSVDFTVRSGTANIFTKQQQFRATWLGEALSTTNLYLQANKGQSLSGPFTTVLLNCEYPVKITYFDTENSMIVSITCKQLWLVDKYFEALTIENLSSQSNAVVVTTMYNKEDDPTYVEDSSESTN